MRILPQADNTVFAKAMRVWVLVCFVLVVVMILLGGATRLTNSGLSITEWELVRGVFPPLTDAQWAVAFGRYQKIPEFMAEHADMQIAGFKFIYFMEWAHRFLGRLIGLSYGLPFLFFLHQRKYMEARYGVILLLIGLQGIIGWWMVKSGLVNERVDVSPYRLAIHLGVAFIILGLLLSCVLKLSSRIMPTAWQIYDEKDKVKMRAGVSLLLALCFGQIVLGALVAGYHAGLSYNTWPLMDGQIVPEGYWALYPLWLNLFANIAHMQFNHRTLAYILLGVSLWMSVRAYHTVWWHLFGVVSLVLLGQVVLGVVALLNVVALPFALAHQAGGLVLFSLLVYARHVMVRC